MEHVSAGGASRDLPDFVNQARLKGELAGSATRRYHGPNFSPTHNLVTKELHFAQNEYNVSDILNSLKNGSGSDAPSLGIHVAQIMVYAHNVRKVVGGHTRFTNCIYNMMISKHMRHVVSALHCYNTIKDFKNILENMGLLNMNESHVETSVYAAGCTGSEYPKDILSFAVNKFGKAVSPLIADPERAFYKKGNIPVETMLKIFEGMAICARRLQFFRRPPSYGGQKLPLSDEERIFFVLMATSVSIATSGASMGWLRQPLVPLRERDSRNFFISGNGIAFRFDRNSTKPLDLGNLYISEPPVSFYLYKLYLMFQFTK